MVLRVEGEGRFKPQPVKIGLRGRDHVEILEGLEDGAEVVVAANFLIDAESNLKAALSTFSAPEAKTAKSYQAVGSVDSVDVSSDTVSMNHEPIPALQWPAMTMDFGLASKDVIEGCCRGNRCASPSKTGGRRIRHHQDRASRRDRAHGALRCSIA